MGRRTAEVCELAWGCLDYDERIDEDGNPRRSLVLIHDMPKVHVVGRRLPVTKAEATLIRSQQQRAKLRYPATSTDRSPLFPAPSKNPTAISP